MATHQVEHVVVDTAAFLKNAPIQDIAENVYTIQDVVSEIRDSATRKRLSVLPYELKFRQPSPESVSAVTEFAKKTGDYPSLSAVDIRVMALTYQLTKEFIGTEHLKTAPANKATWSSSTKPLERATDIVGWYLAPKNKEEAEAKSETGDANLSHGVEGISIEEKEHGSEENKIILERITGEQRIEDGVSVDRTFEAVELAEEVLSDDKNNQNAAEDGGKTETDSESVRRDENDADDDVARQRDESLDVDRNEVDDDDSDGESHGDGRGDSEDGDDEDEDEEGWITPQNIKQAKTQMKDNNMEPLEDVVVGCMTADFAMQNVLIQMGIPVISIGGMLIRRAKSYVLKCSACFKVTSVMTKQFCPKCGNNTLKKVSVTVDEDGTQHYHVSRRKQFNTRGLKYSLPAPKGGKHACNPILVEDQPVPQNRPSKKSLQKTSAFDPEYVANMSPFATNDVTSRAAQLGIGHSSKSAARRNPNENRRKKKR